MKINTALPNNWFPCGSFSHSSGLEAAVKHRWIRHKDDFNKFLQCCLENAGSFGVPFVRASHEACWDTEKLVSLDSLCEACTSNHVANRASSKQGKSLLETASKAFRVEQILDLTETFPYYHHPVVFGCVCGIMDVDLKSTLESFLFGIVRTIVSSAVRMDLIGPVEAQAIQTDLQSRIPDVLNRNHSRSENDACLVFPVIDILQNTHDIMFSKLFYSWYRREDILVFWLIEFLQIKHD